MLELVFAIILALRMGIALIQSLAPGASGTIPTTDVNGKGVVFHFFGHHYELVGVIVARAPEAIAPVPVVTPTVPELTPPPPVVDAAGVLS